MSALFTFDQSFQYFTYLQMQQNCNFYCQPTGKQKLLSMGFEPGTTKQTTWRVTDKVRSDDIVRTLPIL